MEYSSEAPPLKPPSVGIGTSTDVRTPEGSEKPRVGSAADDSEAERLTVMASAVKTLLECIGEDPNREGLQQTPERYAKALLYLTKGYTMDPVEEVNGAVFGDGTGGSSVDAQAHRNGNGYEDLNGHSSCSSSGNGAIVQADLSSAAVPTSMPAQFPPIYPEMIVVRDIRIASLCEHHLVPFDGVVHIGYVPQGRLLGLSKLSRIASVYARRLQVQERLTRQIAEALYAAVTPQGCGVVVECRHMCMCVRGVLQPGATTSTQSLLGSFATNPETRREFLQNIATRR